MKQFPYKKVLAILLVILAVSFVTHIWAQTLLGTISMPWTVGMRKAEMTPKTVSVDIQTPLPFEEITSEDPKLTNPPSTLTVNEETNIVMTLAGEPDLVGISPATFTVQLWKGGMPLYSADLTDAIPTATFTNVGVDTYDIHVGYEVFGATQGAFGTATITLEYP